MSFHLSNPAYLLIILGLFPILTFLIIRTKKMLRLIGAYSRQNKNSAHYLKMRITLRIIFWSLAWVCVSISLAGPSWGTELIPVQKSGRAISFVFDISYSMNAEDTGTNNVSRLSAAKSFSQQLLTVLPGVATSAVLAKGDGVLAVPLTEDYYAVSNLINSLSPQMLSHPGSSLSKGVLKAIESFPPQSARSSYIIVMSDGDDTDEGNALAESVEKALSFGIHVIFVGFGSENETEVLAGDASTWVKTALRAEKLQRIAQKDNVSFVFSQDASSIESIVKIIKPSIFFSDSSTTTSYEIATIKRHSHFICAAIVLFILGICIYSVIPTKIFTLFYKAPKNAMLCMIVLSSFLFSGCSDWLVDAKEVLEGSYQWTQQNYQQSVASFLEVTTRANETENIEILQYGLFGLSSSYIMQGETDASLAKINEMDPNVPQSLDFARWYNKGILFHREGEYRTAAFCFKKALLIDSTNIYAKMNLELCLDEGTVQTQQGIQERIPVQERSDPPGAADAVFSLIRENEGDQWKNQEVTTEESSIIDY